MTAVVAVVVIVVEMIEARIATAAVVVEGVSLFLVLVIRIYQNEWQ